MNEDVRKEGVMNKKETEHTITLIANLATLPWADKKDLRARLTHEITNLVTLRSKHIKNLTRKSLRQHHYESDVEYLTRLNKTIYGGE
jgi:hypothetical protein